MRKEFRERRASGRDTGDWGGVGWEWGCEEREIRWQADKGELRARELRGVEGASRGPPGGRCEEPDA